MSGLPLSQRFELITKNVANLGESPLRQDSPEFQKQLEETIDELTEFKKNVNSLALFSDNESIEDLNTREIKFLALDYYLGSLFIRNINISKKRNLQFAKHLFLQFLYNLDNYAILSKSQSEKLENFKTRHDPQLHELSAQDPTTRRQEKIHNYRLEKDLNNKLQILASNNIDNLDDEVVRSIYFDQLRLFALKTFSALELLLMELEVLANKPEPKIEDLSNAAKEINDDRTLHKSSDLGYTDKLESINNPLLSKTGKILRPFTLVATKNDLKRKVFGYGQEMPSMSVEEYLEEELKNGLMAKPEEPEEEFDEENEEMVDKETYKSRYWDEFKEDNAKGSGNTMNRG